MTIAEYPLRIVKVGGSLLDWPLLKNRLHSWFASQSAARSVLLAGGGELTDAIRRAQVIHQFDDEAAHWMCVRALSVTAKLLATLLPDARLNDSFDDLLVSFCSEGSALVFDPASFLQHAEPWLPGTTLPHDWTATTDSIAARIASLKTADELVLLKSVDPSGGASLAELAASGFVDQHLPIAAAELPRVRLVNLRGGNHHGFTLAR